jgi:hypothetical protein
MDSLGDLGLTLPTPAYLLGMLLFGIYGWVAFRRGKQAASPNLRWSGLVLMLYPYAVSDTWMLWGIGLALCAWVWQHWE